MSARYRELLTLSWEYFTEFMMTNKSNPKDKLNPHSGKFEYDTNLMGDQVAIQFNQGKRTRESRIDREAHVGGGNQSQSRRGLVGTPKR